MTILENCIIFPDGEEQEIDRPLRLNDLVDLNGRVLGLPLPTPRMIVYRVIKIRRQEGRGENRSYHYVELVPAAELFSYCR